jgi:hypothetical protein
MSNTKVETLSVMAHCKRIAISALSAMMNATMTFGVLAILLEAASQAGKM